MRTPKEIVCHCVRCSKGELKPVHVLFWCCQRCRAILGQHHAPLIRCLIVLECRRVLRWLVGHQACLNNQEQHFAGRKLSGVAGKVEHKALFQENSDGVHQGK